MPSAASPYRFAFLSSNPGPWGGSEELWAGVAAKLAKRGHTVTAFKRVLDVKHPSVQAIRQAGGRAFDLERAIVPVPRRLKGTLGRLAARFDRQAIYLRARLSARRPDLVVISQGINFDGWRYAEMARELGLPYVLIAQKASELYWPDDVEADRIRAAYLSATHSYFLSNHNWRLTEDQIAADLSEASIVRNPFAVEFNETPPWPADERSLRLACPARLYAIEKGQDVLLRVLARPKWRQRPIVVSLFGAGQHEEQLRRLAQRLALTSVTFGGFTRDIAMIWRSHHALVLPTRMEGMPIALVEAMLSGRVPIATDAGGVPEIVDNDRTGFVGTGLSEAALDEVMERAWARRGEWREIGARAAGAIRELVPPDPCEEFAKTLLAVVESPRRPSSTH